MNGITKVSEITHEDVAAYLRLSEVTAEEQNTLSDLIGISKTFISNYTGLELDKLDLHFDFVIVVLILCQDMWDNRTLYVKKEDLSYPVQTILGMHSVNLL